MAASVEGPPSRKMGGEEDGPRPIIPAAASSNVDFVSKLAMGELLNHSLAFNAAKNHLYAGYGTAVAVMNVVDRARPALVGWVDVGLAGYIRGLAYPGSGAYVYAAAGSMGGLVKIDVSDPASPSVSGSYNTPGFAYDVFLSGTKAYVADGSSGIRVVDTTTMEESTAYDTPGTAYDVFVMGDYAYVADNTSLQILDVTTSPPIFVKAVAASSAKGVWAATVGAQVLVFVAGGSAPGLRIIDATDPATAYQIGGLNLAGTAWDVAVNPTGDVAYVAATSAGVRVVDVGDPSNPVETTSYDTPGYAEGVLLDGSDVFVADSDFLEILDASSSPPTLTGEYLCGYAWDVAVHSGHAYVAQTKGICVVDIGLPARPRPVVRMPVAAPKRVLVSGDDLYSVGWDLTIQDLSDPASPVEIFSEVLVGNGTDIDVREGYAYISEGTAGLYIYDVSDPSSSTQAGHLDIPGTVSGVRVADSYAYVAGSSGVQIVDVSDPAVPVLTGTLPTTGPAQGLAVTDRYLIVAENPGELEIYDISVPGSPLWTGSRSASTGYAVAATVAGDLCYVADFSNGFRILDISAPWAPNEVGYYDTDCSGSNLSYSDGYVYFTDGTGGAYIFHYSGACFDPHEVNDSFTSAYPVAAGTLYDSKICSSGDYDYYSVALSEGGTVGATMHPPTGQDFDLFLYSPSKSLVAYSMTAGDATETVSYTTAEAGTYYLLVRGHDGSQFSSTQLYSLVPTFSPCASPTQPLIIYMGRKDANDDVILDILDPNQPASVTGYNIYRDTVPNPTTWTLHAANVADADEGTSNVQYIDLGSSSGGPYYYIVRAVNAACGAEGP